MNHSTWKQVTACIYFICISILVVAFCSGCTKEVNGKEINYVLESGDTVIKYTGQLVNGTPEGTCDATIQSGNTLWEYHGTIENSRFANTGTVKDMPYLLCATAGDYSGLYTGDVCNGLPDGLGTFRYSADSSLFTYKGAWKAGEIHGAGQLSSNIHVVHFTNGLDREGSYDGEVVDGIPCGNGEFSATNAEGVHYQYNGEWKDGLFNGQGTIVFDSDEYFNRIGTFTDGEFTPTFTDLFVSLGTGVPKFDLSVKQISMLNFFHNNDRGDKWKQSELTAFLSKYTYSSLKISQYKKKPSDFQNRLIFLGNSRIVQINEYDDLLGYSDVTFRMILANQAGSDIAYAYGIGETPKMYEGTNIHVWGYPLGTSFYDGVDGQTVPCTVIYVFAIAYADQQ